MKKLIKEHLFEEEYNDLDFEGEVDDVVDLDDDRAEFEIYGINADGEEEVLDYASNELAAEEVVNDLQQSFGDEWEIDYREVDEFDEIDELTDYDEDDFMTDYEEDNSLTDLEEPPLVPDEDEDDYDYDDEQINESNNKLINYSLFKD